QVQGGALPYRVVDVVHHVARGEDRLRQDVAQRDVQDHRARPDAGQREVRLGHIGRDGQQVVGGHGLVGAGGDPYGDARQQGGGAAGEVLGPLGRGVEERQLGDGREGRGEVAERLEVDQTAADHGHAVKAGPVEQRAGGG